VSIAGTGGGSVTSSPGGIDCGASCAVVFRAGSAVTLTATADSASVFDGWAGACAGLVATCVVSVDAPVAVTAAFLAAIQLEEDGPGSAFRWGTIADRRALGGSYRADHLAGATATFAFEGPSVTVFVVRGPSMGKGSIAIDDGSAASFDGYAPTFGLEAQRFTELGAGWHTVTVTALGIRRAAATGTRVGVDAVRYAGHTHWQAKPIDGAWAAGADPSASGQAYVVADISGATASLSFTGTGVTMKTAVGPRMGRAEIWVDGVLRRTVDLYAPTRSFGILRTVTGLADAGHTALVVVTGTHRAVSLGTAVVVDGWIVR
jgi:hypothetical protein